MTNAEYRRHCEDSLIASVMSSEEMDEMVGDQTTEARH